MRYIIKNEPTTCIPKSVFRHDFTWRRDGMFTIFSNDTKLKRGWHVNWITKSGPEDESLELLAKSFKNENFNKYKVLSLSLPYILIKTYGKNF